MLPLQGVFPNDRGGFLREPSILGICVPRSCRRFELLTLFSDDSFLSQLPRLAPMLSRPTSSQDGMKQPAGSSQGCLFAAVLMRSLSLGPHIDKGVVCQGESGLVHLEFSFLGRGYHAAVSITCTLFLLTMLVTMVGGWTTERRKRRR